MAKINLPSVTGGYNLSSINTAFEQIEDEFNNKVFYRDNPAGEANQMENDMDMNDFSIYNAAGIYADRIVINGTEFTVSVTGDVIISGSHVDTLAALIAWSNPNNEHFVHVLGRNSINDGYYGVFYLSGADLSTEVAADTSQAIYVAPASDPTGASGAWVRIRPTLMDFYADWYGLNADGTAAHNSTAIVEAVNHMGTRGGNLLFSDGNIKINPSTAVDIPNWQAGRVKFIGIGQEATKIIPGTTGSANYLLTFSDGASDSQGIEFHRIHVGSTVDGVRDTFNGIDIKPTNHVRMVDCFGSDVDGTTWRIERVYNGEIDLKTVNSGNNTGTVPSAFICGKFGAPNGNSTNDVLLNGTSEQDYLGWHVENVFNLRDGSQIKAHGGPNTVKALHLHNVMGELSVMPTLGVTGDDIVVITDQDASSGSELYPMNAFPGYDNTRLRLTVNPVRNIVPQGGAHGNPMSCVKFWLSDPLSHVSVRGMIPAFNVTAPSVCSVFRLAGDGDGIVDITEVQFAYNEDANNIYVQDDRTSKPYDILQRTGPIIVPWVGGEVIPGTVLASPNGINYVGEVGGDDTSWFQSATRNVPVYKYDNTAYGIKIDNYQYPLVGTKVGTISTDNHTLLSGFPMSSSGKAGGGYNTSKATLVKLAFHGYLPSGGTSWAWDASNNWQLEVYHRTTLVATLNLTNGTETSASGDGYPSARGTLTTEHGTNVSLIYEAGIPSYSSGPNQEISILLRMNGTPAAAIQSITDPTVTAWFEESVYPQP